MKYSKFEHYTSQPRLSRFLVACSNSKSEAQKLYRINLRVSQAFYPIFNLFEIFIRNSFNYRISDHFSDPNWIINQKNGFMSDQSLQRSQFYLKKRVRKAERTIRRKGDAITPGKVIAEQTLGFWTSLFDPHHYRLINGVVIQCFENKPAHVNRNTISNKLNRIRKLRNRIYHNEPICFNSNTINFDKAIQIKDDIYDLLSWIDADLVQYIDYFDSVNRKINSARNI